jgi:hypothetical protein
MSQVATATNSGRATSREMALARRKAMSYGGKAAIKSEDRTASEVNGTSAAASPAPRASATRLSSIAATPAPGGDARSASLARRKAMSSRGKAGVTSKDRVNAGSRQQPAKVEARTPESDVRTIECGCGCGGVGKACNTDVETNAPSSPIETSAASPASRLPRARMPRRPMISSSTAKSAALARRKALSSRGKAGIGDGPMSAAQTARASNPKLSGRELAKVLRDQRSKRGGAGQPKSAPCGRVRKAQEAKTGAAQDAPWKVGASETGSGQVVTGTMVGRNENMTGDEPSTCRTITGTEYLGADIFNKFCQGEVNKKPAVSTMKKVMVTTTSHGNAVSGNRMGRGSNVTGNEPGTCKRVTGGEYVSAEQTQGWCGEFAQKSPRKVSMAETMKGKAVTGNNVGRSEKVTGDEPGMGRQLTGAQYTMPEEIGKAPAKVGTSKTLRGGNVTGSMVGRRKSMTGDEAGSCRNVTGDDYIGQEQYSGFCSATPAPKDRKVGVSNTLSGHMVTGSLADRSKNVTGNEPGTCKAVTGTPYSGGEQYNHYCKPEQQAEAKARMQSGRGSWGKPMTGLQPGIGGTMTGDDKGACENVSGTPYVGADQAAAACPATPAEPGSADYPQTLGQTPWGDFSVQTPAHAAHYDMSPSNVTGSHYETGSITGPFGMAAGKVTGTEQARFDRPQAETVTMPQTAGSIDGRIKSRITGEGMDAGTRITGDDWDRGDRVTGTEGASATRRNQTLRSGAMTAMPAASMVKPEGIPVPVSKVTGGSGNTEKGSLITYSGGARG